MQGKGNYVILGNRIIESDHSHGSIRIPIKTGLQFQRAFSAFFDRLPSDETPIQRVLCGLFIP
jgi:hypothetical protein